LNLVIKNNPFLMNHNIYLMNHNAFLMNVLKKYQQLKNKKKSRYKNRLIYLNSLKNSQQKILN
jgi:hypothetical protein